MDICLVYSKNYCMPIIYLFAVINKMAIINWLIEFTVVMMGWGDVTIMMMMSNYDARRKCAQNEMNLIYISKDLIS